MKPAFTIGYFLYGMVYLWIVSVYPQMNFVMKPLIMISLIIAYWRYADNPKKLFLIALGAAWLGDVILLHRGSGFFLAGLFSFLVMQVIYTYIFWKEKGEFHSFKLIGTVLVAIMFTASVAYIYEDLDPPMRIPVILYALCITAMAITALWRKVDIGYLSIFFGSIFFMVSDLSLAIDLYSSPIPYRIFMVMGTYIIAQYCIVAGRISSD